MRNEARGDVWKVWLYAAASVVGGAWISPMLYNAGKALAEVSSQKTTNGFLEWLAGVCRKADFPAFYVAGIVVAAALLFFPWMEWIHAKSGGVVRSGPWKIRLPNGARERAKGQSLRKNLRGPWQCCAGFLLVAGLLLPMGIALVPAGFFTMRSAGNGLGSLAFQTLPGAIGLAVAMEILFRGIVMGIFLRAMRPASALGMTAAFFAITLSMIPQRGLNVADPEASGIGFELLRKVAGSFSDWQMVCGNIIPLLALGGVLAYARWRTASLWLPVGLHTGWLFSKALLGKLTATSVTADTNGPIVLAGLLQQGVVPLTGILLAGVLAHYLTENPNDESPVRP